MYIIGTTVGQTNVYFFDVDGRQIGALDIVVTAGPQQPPSRDSGLPEKVVDIYRGTGRTSYSCSPTICIAPEEAANPNTTYTDITTHNK